MNASEFRNSGEVSARKGMFKFKFATAIFLCLIVSTSTVLAVGRCVPCKLNHYCVDGLRYQCPSTAPVTQGTGAGALSECLTCVQRNGNEGNPVYDDLVGDCVSCYEYDSSTPLWNGSACVACESGSTYNVQTGECDAPLTCSSDPILISTAEQLASIGKTNEYPAFCNYGLISSEYDLSGYDWEPIENFSGTLEALTEVTITNLTINKPNQDNVGMFASSSGEIKNIMLKNLNINGKENVGALVGSNTGTIEYCSIIDSTISGSTYIGGIAGSNTGTLNGPVLDNTTISATTYAGGFAGYNSGEIGNVANDDTTSTISAQNYAGGIVGYNIGYIHDSSSENINVSATNYYAGCVAGGHFAPGNIERCAYDCSANEPSSTNCQGGIVGQYSSTAIFDEQEMSKWFNIEQCIKE